MLIDSLGWHYDINGGLVNIIQLDDQVAVGHAADGRIAVYRRKDGHGYNSVNVMGKTVSRAKFAVGDSVAVKDRKSVGKVTAARRSRDGWLYELDVGTGFVWYSYEDNLATLHKQFYDLSKPVTIRSERWSVRLTGFNPATGEYTAVVPYHAIVDGYTNPEL